MIINCTIGSSADINKSLQLCFKTSCFYDFVIKSLHVQLLKFSTNPPHTMLVCHNTSAWCVLQLNLRLLCILLYFLPANTMYRFPDEHFPITACPRLEVNYPLDTCGDLTAVKSCMKTETDEDSCQDHVFRCQYGNKSRSGLTWRTVEPAIPVLWYTSGRKQKIQIGKRKGKYMTTHLEFLCSWVELEAHIKKIMYEHFVLFC